MSEPVAWRTFDGEGGYDYRTYEDNETYRDDYIARNGPRYRDWVEPLYTAPTDHTEVMQQALEALENCTSEHGHRCTRCDSEVDEGGKVIAALRAALGDGNG
ncbi:MAG: hypothetical protein RL756_693 [Pseudomonadota bacterium]|jgi:hypothetical protein